MSMLRNEVIKFLKAEFPGVAGIVVEQIAAALVGSKWFAPPAADAEIPLADLPPLNVEELIPGRVRLVVGDSMIVLRQLATTGIVFDATATDPPYHFESIVKRFGKANSARAIDPSYHQISKNFIGKEWDGGDLIFRPPVWKLVLSVMKPGAHVAAFSADKYYHRMGSAMEAAGLEPRHMIAWLYGSGRLKAKDLAKMVAKKYGVQAAHDFVGWATALKPGLEPIALFRKKLETNHAYTMKHFGTGGLNIAACGIPVTNDPDPNQTSLIDGGDEAMQDEKRFPPNVVHDASEDVESIFSTYGDAGASTPPKGGGRFFGDSGSPSRFFYSAKASKAEKGETDHPTVKPVDLMAWLVRLMTPKGGTVLDPFAGTGSTGVACLREGFNVFLIEKDPEYADDIRERFKRVTGADTPLFAAR